MAGSASYETIDVVLVDPDRGARQSARTILHNAGFRDIRQGEDLATVVHVVDTFMPDLLLCADTLPDGRLSDFTRRLRLGKRGHNPFLPVIALLDAPTPEVVRDLVDAGVDDVASKPLSTAALLERITALIRSRKPFTATEGYLGPVRRGDPADGAVRVPNTLRTKAMGEKVSYFELEHAINTAKQALEDRQLERIGIELAGLVGRIAPLLERGEVNEVAAGGLATLADQADAACARLEGSRFDHVSALCRALAEVARRLHAQRGQAPEPREVMLLRPLSQAIQAGFAGGITSAEAARKIVQQITRR